MDVTLVPGERVEPLRTYRPVSDEELRDMVNVVEEDAKVLVHMHMAHIRRYGHPPIRTLVYKWRGGPLEVGDFVECPGTRLHPAPFTGVVVGFGDNGYKGPCKYIIRRLPRGEGVTPS